MNILQTKRLTLRHWQESDLEPFAKLNACPKVCKTLAGILTSAESDNLSQRIITHFSKHNFGLNAVEITSTKEFIGFVGLSIPSFEADFMPAVEIDWRLSAHSWGNGYATEAAKAVLEHGFTKLDLSKIVSFTTETNIASRRVMEKIGLQYQKDFNHPSLPKDHPLLAHVLYSKTSKE